MVIVNFNTIKWQEDISANLKNSIKTKTLGHAILFSSDVSTGIMLANATADSILCKEPVNGNACLKCSNCTKTAAGSHPDKFIITAKKNSIGVNEIREVINQIYIKPCNSEYKIFVFEEAYKLTTEAQNALLKILEQPPEYGIIILIVNKEEELLPTVLSRLKKFSVKQPDKDQVAEYLYIKYPGKREMARFAATYCEGDPNGAEQFIQNDCDFDRRKRILTFLNQLTLREKSVIFDFSKYLTEDKEKLTSDINYIHLFLRDILFLKNGLSKNAIINSDLYSELEKLSSKFSVRNIENFSSALSTVLENQKKNSALKLSVTTTLISIWEDIHDRNS